MNATGAGHSPDGEWWRARPPERHRPSWWARGVAAWLGLWLLSLIFQVVSSESLRTDRAPGLASVGFVALVAAWFAGMAGTGFVLGRRANWSYLWLSVASITVLLLAWFVVSIVAAPGFDAVDLTGALVASPGLALLVVSVTAGIGAGSGLYLRRQSLRTRSGTPTTTVLVTALGAVLTIVLAGTGISWANGGADLAPVVFIPAFGLALASFGGLVLLPWAGRATAQPQPHARNGDPPHE